MSVRYKDEDGNIHIIPTGANYWTGTWDEYQSAKANIANGTYINITDKDSGVVEQTLSDSFNAVSGKAVKAVTDDIEETLSSVPRTVDTLATAADAVRDADTLGGHAVSYYATKSSVDTVNDSLNSFRHLNYRDKVYASVTLNASGYFKFADTSEGLPTGIGTIVMANVYSWGSISSKDAINVTPVYVLGTANATITNLAVRFWYV